MRIVNGKLINQTYNQFDELTQKTERINQRCESLESQVIALTRKDCTQYVQQINQEVNSNKSSLQKLEQKICLLQKVTSRQAKQLSFFKIGSLIGFVVLWLMFNMNNQPKYNKTQPQKKAEVLELLQPEFRNML